MTIGWIVLAVYLLGWLPAAVVVASALEKSLPSDDATERAMNVVLGLLAGLFWPLVIPGAWVYKKVFPTKEGDDATDA